MLSIPAVVRIIYTTVSLGSSPKVNKGYKEKKRLEKSKIWSSRQVVFSEPMPFLHVPWCTGRSTRCCGNLGLRKCLLPRFCQVAIFGKLSPPDWFSASLNQATEGYFHEFSGHVSKNRSASKPNRCWVERHRYRGKFKKQEWNTSPFPSRYQWHNSIIK